MRVTSKKRKRPTHREKYTLGLNLNQVPLEEDDDEAALEDDELDDDEVVEFEVLFVVELELEAEVVEVDEDEDEEDDELELEELVLPSRKTLYMSLGS